MTIHTSARASVSGRRTKVQQLLDLLLGFERALKMFRRWAAAVGVGAVAFASTDLLASENLLPRRVALHALALVLAALAIHARRRGDGRLGVFAFVAVWASVASPLWPMTLPRLLDVGAALVIAWAISTRAVGRAIWVRALIVVALLTAVVGLIEQWVPLDLNEASRPAGLLASRTTAGVFVAAVLPLLLLRRRRLDGWVMLAVIFVVSTASRAAWLGAACGCAWVLWRQRRMQWSLVAGLVVGLIATPGPQLRWKSPTPYVDAARTSIAAAQGRWPTWVAAVRALEERPLLGWGPGQFSAVGPRFQAQMEEPHNEWLRLAFELGLLGVLAAGLVVAKVRPRPALLVLAIAACSGKTFVEPPTFVAGAVLLGLWLRGPLVRASSGLLSAGVWVATVLCVLFVDVTQVIGSRNLLLAMQRLNAGQPRSALELLAQSDQFDARTWALAVDAAQQSGDWSQCRLWLEQGLRRLLARAAQRGVPVALIRRRQASRESAKKRITAFVRSGSSGSSA